MKKPSKKKTSKPTKTKQAKAPTGFSYEIPDPITKGIYRVISTHAESETDLAARLATHIALGVLDRPKTGTITTLMIMP